MKKVIFFLPSGVGGAQKMTIQIARLLPKYLYNVKIVLVGGSEIGDMANCIPNDIPYEILNIRNVWDFLTFRIMRILRKEHPQVVFSSLMPLNVRVIISASFLGNIKIVVRNNNMLVTQSWLRRLFLRLSYPFAHCIIAQQEEMRDELIKEFSLKPERVFVRYNPVDIESILEKSNEDNPYKQNNEIRYIWTGNFMKTGSKGQDVLVKAFSLVHKVLPEAHLYLLGVYYPESSYFKEIESFIETNKLHEFVHLPGFQKNPYPWIKNAHCFVLPSRVEGLPNSLIDAMVLNKPVVATTCIPMISRMIDNGKNGYLVPPEDHILMSKAMIEALNLSDFQMIYRPSSSDDFVELF